MQKFPFNFDSKQITKTVYSWNDLIEIIKLYPRTWFLAVKSGGSVYFSLYKDPSTGITLEEHLKLGQNG